ncbi:S-layer homology domain-containing protein [Aceticella autotrophica]|uniref:S-layer homology domain-containing protein n=1 Tax=Aceticella autotrophica TaxID=2755338 RepID=A0A975GAM6_9THEO|nr:S-layer homology domain-containing protein [Aceticella autotrophica]QSZ27548.1 S-layer homology domain-containing protein [Aceticella autotrophica]
MIEMIVGKKKHFSKVLALIIAMLMLIPSIAATALAAPTNTTTAKQFTDIKGHWAEKEINDWASKGLIAGYEDNTFRPDNSVTRAEFVTFTNRAFNLTQTADITFKDVNKADWFYNEIQKAKAANIVSGYDDNTFRPNNFITREEAAAILTRLLKLQPVTQDALKGFKDASNVSDWAKDAVNTAVYYGLIKGYPDNTIGPDKPITRAETVVILNRALNLQQTPTPSYSVLTNKAIDYLHNQFTKNGASDDSYNGINSYTTYILMQSGVDVNTWLYNGKTLPDAIIQIANGHIANSKTPAKALAQDYIAMKALGKTDIADKLANILKNKQTDKGFDSGELSIYSNMFAYDIMLRAGSSDVLNAVYAKDYILSTQCTVAGDAYGSWGTTWSGTYYADFMATAEAVRSLHYLDPNGNDPNIQKAIKDGFDWMKKQQKADGSFVAGMDDNLIDASEMILTAKVLGIDPASIKSSDGKSPVDYLLNNAINPDGSFGTCANAMDATWVLSALNSLK